MFEFVIFTGLNSLDSCSKSSPLIVILANFDNNFQTFKNIDDVIHSSSFDSKSNCHFVKFDKIIRISLKHVNEFAAKLFKTLFLSIVVQDLFTRKCWFTKHQFEIYVFSRTEFPASWDNINTEAPVWINFSINSASHNGAKPIEPSD